MSNKSEVRVYAVVEGVNNESTLIFKKLTALVVLGNSIDAPTDLK